MLATITNTPRDYAWGSTTLLADLQGRPSTGRREAEIWFGDHPGSPAVVADGRTLDAWLADEAPHDDAPVRLPYLLKLLAAASALSIQAHPSRAQAAEGFAREEAAGIPRDAAERTYRDDNHKPELIVAVSDTFTALAGLRDLGATRRLVAGLGASAAGLSERLGGSDAAAALRDTLEWVLSDAAAGEVRAVIAAAAAGAGRASGEFADELRLVARLADESPADPGIVVAMLMNLVTIRRGEGIFVPAGVLHAYLEGLGVEIMAASDNVLRGGLTPKHIDVPELLRVLDTAPGPAPVLRPEPVGDGVVRYPTPVADFALLRADVSHGRPARIPLSGVAIAVVTDGTVTVSGRSDSVDLAPGRAVVLTVDEGAALISGEGTVFLAQPGATASGAAAA